jgi:hypothetical protein
VKFSVIAGVVGAVLYGIALAVMAMTADTSTTAMITSTLF